MNALTKLLHPYPQTTTPTCNYQLPTLSSKSMARQSSETPLLIFMNKHASQSTINILKRNSNGIPHYYTKLIGAPSLMQCANSLSLIKSKSERLSMSGFPLEFHPAMIQQQSKIGYALPAIKLKKLQSTSFAAHTSLEPKSRPNFSLPSPSYAQSATWVPIFTNYGG